MAKRKQAHAGGHGWFVTFADLMGLLVSFFVMLVAFSKNAAHIDPEDASATPTTDEQDHKREHGAHLKNDQAFACPAMPAGERQLPAPSRLPQCRSYKFVYSKFGRARWVHIGVVPLRY
jgi:chemotaxis protein MotB